MGPGCVKKCQCFIPCWFRPQEKEVTMAQGPGFYIYEDSAGEYRWRLRAANNEIVADSAEGYDTMSGARDAAQRVVRITHDDRLHFHE
jgi:uncharacterized protein YegP (UPF0339 family)